MKKIVGLTLALFCGLVSVMSLVGCAKPVDNSESTLEISVYDAGYGYDFVERWEEKFEEDYEGIDVVISKSSNISPRDLISSGPRGNTVDLFIWGDNFNAIATAGSQITEGYDCALEPIDSVLSTTVEGEPILQKFMDGYTPTQINGHYYSFSWAVGMCGLVYNATLFQKNGYPVPNTTKELLDVCKLIKEDKLIPFVFSTSTGYWAYMRDIWYMQYQGVQGMNNFLNGIDDTGAYSREIYHQEGRRVALETVNDLVNIENGNNHGSVSTLSFTQAQARLILGDGLMMVNGDWLENEMKSVADEDPYHYEFRMMSPPIVSAIIDQLPSIPQDDPDKADEFLSKAIDYIDGEIEYAEIGCEISETDLTRLREARNCRFSLGSMHSVCIPVYATAKDAAKDFLRYMATEEAQLIYMDCTSGNMLPFDYDLEGNEELWSQKSAYSKSAYELTKNAIYFGDFKIYGLQNWTGGREHPEVYFAAQNSKDRLTPKQIWDAEYDYWTEDRFRMVLRAAGKI